ncbi:hypothetical protein [Phormidium sp. CCY1219]|uniref:hypothetical protein n=1 Tax=Phormidium sp. CCY1219 TaxID=2886104 RepID=UPI002D1EE4A1|nr:hypothetical protein [Phormidium sp. CCY1219]MEB3830336.1 hypothetical protein [Phormidium sp. CCY1219]
MNFFFPEIYREIDWEEPYMSLSQELPEIVGESASGDTLSDRLFQVKLLDGEPWWVIIHVEVQSQYQTKFNERIYIYNYSGFQINVVGNSHLSQPPMHRIGEKFFTAPRCLINAACGAVL